MVRVFLPTVPRRTPRLRAAAFCQTVAESGSEPWQLVPKRRFCSELLTNRASFFSNSTPTCGTRDHFSRRRAGSGVGGYAACLPRGASGSPWAGAGPRRARRAGRGRYLLTDGGLHICLSLKPRWIGFLDVYLPRRSRALGPRSAQLRTPR